MCVHAKWLQSTLCNLVDCSPPGSSVHGILQVRIPEWVAIPFSRGYSWPRDRTCVSCIAGKFFTTEPLGNPKWAIIFFFNWRIIALQNFVVFCQTSTWLSHRYPYIPSLWTSPFHPSRLIQSPWVSWAIQQIPVGYLFYILLFPYILPLLPSPHVHKSILWFSTAAL